MPKQKLAISPHHLLWHEVPFNTENTQFKQSTGRRLYHRHHVCFLKIPLNRYNSLRRPNFKAKWKRFSTTRRMCSVLSYGCSQHPRWALCCSPLLDTPFSGVREELTLRPCSACLINWGIQNTVCYLPAGSHVVWSTNHVIESHVSSITNPTVRPSSIFL